MLTKIFNVWFLIYVNYNFFLIDLHIDLNSFTVDVPIALTYIYLGLVWSLKITT